MLRSTSSSSPALSPANRGILGLIHLGDAHPAEGAVLYGRAPVVDRVIQLCADKAPDRAALTEALDALRAHLAECEAARVEDCPVASTLEAQMSEHCTFCRSQIFRAEKILADAQEVKTTAEGFVKFRARDWSRRADKGTWARFQGATLTIQRAPRGLLSSAYEAELEDFCQRFGLDFADVHAGDRVTVEVCHA